jgi:beta-phosphoglucomutase-like phosphatase (HAD superfamily)
VSAPAIDPGAVRVLLCDADGNLFPSEGPAFEASTAVTNRLLADLGVEHTFTPEALRARAMGRNFRATALDLAAELGVAGALGAAELESRVIEEEREVTAHLGRVLRPDPAVREPLERLGRRFGLAVVSSSALARLDACFEATGLAGLFPAGVRYSAEDSLPVPTSKPDPAVYRLAGERLGVSGAAGLAIEDAVPGVESAVAAGFATIGNIAFVAPDERGARVAALRAAGATAVVASWAELEALLDAAPAATPRARAAAPAG